MVHYWLDRADFYSQLGLVLDPASLYRSVSVQQLIRDWDLVHVS